MVMRKWLFNIKTNHSPLIKGAGGLLLCVSAVIYAGCAGPTELGKILQVDENPAWRDGVKRTARLSENVLLTPINIEIAPVTDTALSSAGNEKYIQPDKAALATKLIEAFGAYNVFERIGKLPDNLTARKDQIAEARNRQATLLMNMTVKKFRVYYIGGSSATAGNTVLWFLGTVPCFWTHDQLYGVEITAEVSLLDITSSEEFAVPVVSYTTTFQSEGGMSFLERGFNILIFILPPQFCSTDWNKVQEFVADNATNYFLVKLAEQTKKELRSAMESK